MKSVACWQDLEPYGFVTLTGEACGLMYRVLFDVTAAGLHVVQKCFSVPDLRLPEPWNRGAPDAPHVGSIMLSPEMMVPLAVFALLESGCTEVLCLPRRAIGIEPTDSVELAAALKERHKPDRVLRYSGTAGDRNVHLMSGRVT